MFLLPFGSMNIDFLCEFGINVSFVLLVAFELKDVSVAGCLPIHVHVSAV